MEARLNQFLSDADVNFTGEVTTHAMRNTLRRIIVIGFSDTLTTNYSYKLEIAATDMAQIRVRLQIKTKNIQMRFVGRKENTFARVSRDYAYGSYQ